MKHRWRALGIAFCLGVAAVLPMEARSSHPAKIVSAVPRTIPSHFTFEPHPTVALTFDDLPAAGGLAPGETRTAIIGRLAAELKANHLKGTYGFVTAADLTGDPDSQQALRIWVASGMNLGNHTFSHPSLTSDSAAAFERNIALDEPALRRYAGNRNWHWFRYPYLEEGQTPDKQSDVRDWLFGHGYRIAQVTLNFDDDEWSDPYDRCLAQHNDAGIAWLRQSYLQNAAQFIRVGREEEQLAFGHEIPSVLLLHATALTTLMLPGLLQLLHQRGFRFAPLAKVEQNPAYRLDPGVGLADGGPLTNEFLRTRHLQFPPFTPEPLQQLDSLCQ